VKIGEIYNVHYWLRGWTPLVNNNYENVVTMSIIISFLQNALNHNK